MERAASKGYTVPNPAAQAGVVRRALERAGLDLASRFVPFTPPFSETAVKYLLRRSSYSIEGARQALGYSPAVDLAEGMARMAAEL